MGLDFSFVTFIPQLDFRLPSGQIRQVTAFVNRMSRKRWYLRHGLRTLKIRNWRECVYKSKDSGDSCF
jgi:hypothetical protein